jgi:hypothetical protein
MAAEDSPLIQYEITITGLPASGREYVETLEGENWVKRAVTTPHRVGRGPVFQNYCMWMVPVGIRMHVSSFLSSLEVFTMIDTHVATPLGATDRATQSVYVTRRV